MFVAVTIFRHFVSLFHQKLNPAQPLGHVFCDF